MIVSRSISRHLVGSQIAWPLLGYLVWAILVAVANSAGLAWSSFPALPISLLAATLGILLGFRNNSGYDRWWEARTLWGGVVNQSRTFARQVLTFLPTSPADADARPVRPAPTTGVVRTPLLETAMASAGGGPDALPGRLRWRRRGDGAVRTAEGRAMDPDPVGAAVDPDRSETDPQRAALRAAARQVAERDAPAPSHHTDGDDEADGPAVEPCHPEQVSAEARELVHAQIGFVHAMRCHLRRQDPHPEIAPFFRRPVREALRGEQNVPAAILAWMAIRLRRLLDGRRPDDTFRLAALDGTLAELTNLLGGCERIKNTPIPRQYDFLLRAMVRAYLTLLPFGLVQDLGLGTPIVTSVVAAFFLALDQIGRNVETPFEDDVHDTPMTALCRTIEINLRQMLGETELPPPVEPQDGVLY